MTMNEKIEAALLEWEKIYGAVRTYESALKMVQYVFRNYGKMILHDESKSPSNQASQVAGDMKAMHGTGYHLAPLSIESVIHYILNAEIPMPLGDLFKEDSHISKKEYGVKLLQVLCGQLRIAFPDKPGSDLIAELREEIAMDKKYIDEMHIQSQQDVTRREALEKRMTEFGRLINYYQPAVPTEELLKVVVKYPINGEILHTKPTDEEVLEIVQSITRDPNNRTFGQTHLAIWRAAEDFMKHTYAKPFADPQFLKEVIESPEMKIVIKEIDATHKEAVLVIDDVCPHCHEGNLKRVAPDEPWHDQHLICPKCDSTYLWDDAPKDIPELSTEDAAKIEAIEQEWMNAPMGKFPDTTKGELTAEQIAENNKGDLQEILAVLEQTSFVGDHHES